MTTKSELISAVAAASGYPKATVTPVINAFVEQVAKDLADFKKVDIHGLGVFSVKDTAARVGRNPATGEAIDIPAGKKIAFRPTQSLKDRI